jgi:hypothetical protein
MREADVGSQSADTIKLNFRFRSGIMRAFRLDVGQVRTRERGCLSTTTLARPRGPCRARHPYAVPRTLFQCLCTRRRNCIGQLSPFLEYALTANRIKPDLVQFKGTHYLSLSRLGRHTARRQRLLSGTPTGRRFDVSGMERPFQKRASSFRREQSSKRPDAHLPGVACVGPSR